MKHITIKFIPKDYEQYNYIKLNTLRQGLISVEEYLREFVRLALVCHIHERKKQTCNRFLVGLNLMIRDKVENCLYDSLADMIKHSLRFEKQIKSC